MMGCDAAVLSILLMFCPQNAADIALAGGFFGELFDFPAKTYLLNLCHGQQRYDGGNEEGDRTQDTQQSIDISIL